MYFVVTAIDVHGGGKRGDNLKWKGSKWKIFRIFTDFCKNALKSDFLPPCISPTVHIYAWTRLRRSNAIEGGKLRLSLSNAKRSSWWIQYSAVIMSCQLLIREFLCAKIHVFNCEYSTWWNKDRLKQDFTVLRIYAFTKCSELLFLTHGNLIASGG